MYDTGAGGVRIGSGISYEQPVDMYNIGTVVTNCILELGGKVYQEGCGVLAQNVAQLHVSHNTISNYSYTGVSVGTL